MLQKQAREVFCELLLSQAKALFDYSESETSLLNPTVSLLTSPAVNANPTVSTDSNRELVWPKLVPDSCVIKQNLDVCNEYLWMSVAYQSSKYAT